MRSRNLQTEVEVFEHTLRLRQPRGDQPTEVGLARELAHMLDGRIGDDVVGRGAAGDVLVDECLVRLVPGEMGVEVMNISVLSRR